MIADPKETIVVCGPTASGKSLLAVKLAKALQGEIVNIDSVQVYKNFDIGSGKITKEEEQGIPHHLIDLRTANNPINVAEYIAEAHAIINDIILRKKKVIIVAGTSLYVKCLFHGLLDAPGENAEVRSKLEKHTTSELVSVLEKIDQKSLRQIAKTDRVRIIRAIEVFETTGMQLSALQEEHQHKESLHRGLFLILCWSREKLYDRINKRCEDMIKLGLIEETKMLLDEFGASQTALKSLGYAQVTSHLSGLLSADQLLSEMSTKTRQFAKRQLTFWRNQPKQLGWKIVPRNGEGFVINSQTAKGLQNVKIKDDEVLQLTFNQLTEAISNSNLNRKESNEAWYLDAQHLFRSN